MKRVILLSLLALLSSFSSALAEKQIEGIGFVKLGMPIEEAFKVAEVHMRQPFYASKLPSDDVTSIRYKQFYNLLRYPFEVTLYSHTHENVDLIILNGRFNDRNCYDRYRHVAEFYALYYNGGYYADQGEEWRHQTSNLNQIKVNHLQVSSFKCTVSVTFSPVRIPKG